MAAKLYDLELSGNCYKVRLLAALLGVPLEIVPVDFMAGAHKTAPLIDLNPFGQIPVLCDGDLVLRDSQAILVYLARKHGGEAWLPTDAVSMAKVLNWLFVTENEIARGPNDARLHDKFDVKLDIDAARANAARILGIVNAHLTGRKWLEVDRPTIADIACMPYIALSHEGGISLDPYPAVKTWIGRIKELPGYIEMPAI